MLSLCQQCEHCEVTFCSWPFLSFRAAGCQFGWTVGWSPLSLPPSHFHACCSGSLVSSPQSCNSFPKYLLLSGLFVCKVTLRNHLFHKIILDITLIHIISVCILVDAQRNLVWLSEI